jgi:hypothetical protein
MSISFFYDIKLDVEKYRPWTFTTNDRMGHSSIQLIIKNSSLLLANVTLVSSRQLVVSITG